MAVVVVAGHLAVEEPAGDRYGNHSAREIYAKPSILSGLAFFHTRRYASKHTLVSFGEN
ncbi:UNVERIFIED_CONTAM: hypothetical protein ABID98_001942 [Brevibacillus sp. OAP136]